VGERGHHVSGSDGKGCITSMYEFPKSSVIHWEANLQRNWLYISFLFRRSGVRYSRISLAGGGSLYTNKPAHRPRDQLLAIESSPDVLKNKEGGGEGFAKQTK